jgi:peptidoglycan/LPS O-acetylase OafA/YrhL
MQTADRVPVIDGLRGTAILLVLLYHVYEKTHYSFGINLLGGVHLDAHTFIQGGYLGVELFFFVSGFCLMLPYARWIAGKRDEQPWREYASRRFWKIVPSYYLALFAIALFFPFNAQPGISRLEDVVLHLTFLHSFNAASFVSLNGNFWSLAVEVQFYLLFPLIVLAFARKPIVTGAAVVSAGLVFSYFIASTHRDVYFIWSYDLLSFLPLFALGILCAYVYERWIHDAEIGEGTRVEMSFVCAGSILALGYLFEQMNRNGGGFTAWAWQNGHRFEIALVLSVFTLSALCATREWQAIVANPVLRFYSDISYNMYLWNAPIVALIAARWWGDEGWRGLVFCALAITASTSAGFILTRFFERPLMRYRTSSLRRLGQSVAALARRYEPVRVGIAAGPAAERHDSP